MTKVTLFIYFKTSAGNEQKISIKDVRENVSASEVATLAREIIDKKIFQFGNNTLTSYVRSELEVSEITALV